MSKLRRDGSFYRMFDRTCIQDAAKLVLVAYILMFFDRQSFKAKLTAKTDSCLNIVNNYMDNLILLIKHYSPLNHFALKYAISVKF